MYMSRIFLWNTNWICLLQNYFSSYVYLRDIYKTLKGIAIIQFVSELTILLNLEISKFHHDFMGVFTNRIKEIIKAGILLLKWES